VLRHQCPTANTHTQDDCDTTLLRSPAAQPVNNITNQTLAVMEKDDDVANPGGVLHVSNHVLVCLLVRIHSSLSPCFARNITPTPNAVNQLKQPSTGRAKASSTIMVSPSTLP
jgi:hypothetical protein